MKKMKKMLVALLAMTMILSSFGAVHADAGTAVTGWSGDGVYAVNPVGTDDVLKLTNGETAELALKSFGAGGALVTVDFYAAAFQTSTIALLPNGKEETHGSITLSADGKVNGAASYTAARWHTAQLLVLPGTDQYEVYLDDRFVAAGTAHIPGLPGVPGKLKVAAGGELYLNNVKIEKVQKQLDTGMNAAYTSDFSGAAIGTALSGKNGWTTPTATEDVEYTVAADPAPGEAAAANVVKIVRKTKDGNIRMTKKIDLTSNDVAVEAWVYQTAYEAVNEANALNIFLRNGQNRQVQLVSLLRNNVYIGMNPTYGQTGAAATFRNQYTAGQWVKVRAELVGETGSLNVYVDNKLVNEVPVGTKQLHNGSGDSMEAESAQLDFGEFAGYKELDFEVKNAPGTWYVKDIKVEQGAVSQGEVTLFDEDFEDDNAAAAFTHEGGNGTDQNLNLTPVNNALSDSDISRKVGYLADHTWTQSDTVHYLEDGTGADNEAHKLAPKTKEYYTADFSAALSQVKNLKQLKLSFRHYTSALARKNGSPNTIRDTLQIGLNSSAQVYRAEKGGEPRLKIQGGNVYSGLVNNTVDRSNTKISGTASDRAWNTQEMIYDNTTGVVTVSTNGVARSYCVDSRGNKVADTDLSYTAGKGTELGHLNMEIETTNGGGYYLDDIKVTAVCDVAETNVKDDYTAAAFLADAIQENPFSLDSVVTDGNTVTAVKLTKQQETSGDVYLFVASYSATGMIQCAVEKVDAQLKEQQTVSLTDVIDTEEASKVKAFLFDGDLVPLARLYTVK